MKELPIRYVLTKGSEEMMGILELQRRNLPEALDHLERSTEGYVTVEHDLVTLSRIHGGIGHMVAKHNDKIIGYALTMLQKYSDEIEVLKPMFHMFNQTRYDSRKLDEFKFVVMGQVCIDKAFRKKGVFRGLYENMKESLNEYFQIIVTEIDSNNTRSLNAHLSSGFEIIHVYHSNDHIEWNIVAMKLKEPF